MNRRSRRPSKPRGQRLNTSFAGTIDEPVGIPVRWVKFIVGLFLLPPCYVLTAAFFSALTHATVRYHFWATEEFWFFGLGAIMWLIIYFGLPRPLVVYVFGHELTHALVVLLMGGRVSQFRVGRDGGHIVSSKINTWIALSPYFVPIYSVIVIGLYGIGSLFCDLTPYRAVLYVLLGGTWTFHATFTLSMIPKGQTDLAYGGTFFSLTVIYLMNLLLLSLLLIIATPHVSFASFGRELFAHAATFAAEASRFFDFVIRSAGI